jgi:hypothetical protein
MKALKLLEISRRVQAMKPQNCGSNFESTGVVFGEKYAARPGSNLFLGIFLFNGEQWNVGN